MIRQLVFYISLLILSHIILNYIMFRSSFKDNWQGFCDNTFILGFIFFFSPLLLLMVVILKLYTVFYKMWRGVFKK